MKKNKIFKKTVSKITTLSILMSLFASQLVMATTDNSAIINPLLNLKTLLIAVLGTIGVIVLVKNAWDFASAYQGNDTSSMSSAVKGIAAGVMMAGISTVLVILGF